MRPPFPQEKQAFDYYNNLFEGKVKVGRKKNVGDLTFKSTCVYGSRMVSKHHSGCRRGIAHPFSKLRGTARIPSKRPCGDSRLILKPASSDSVISLEFSKVAKIGLTTHGPQKPSGEVHRGLTTHDLYWLDACLPVWRNVRLRAEFSATTPYMGRLLLAASQAIRMVMPVGCVIHAPALEGR